MKTFLLVIGALLFNSVVSYAQWNATLNIVPYPSPYVSDWQNNTSQVGQLMIFNNSNSPAKVKIQSIARLQGVGKVFEGTSDELTIEPGIPTTIDVTKLIKFGEATFPERHLKNQSIETGRLPEGQYELSITILNPSNPQTPLVSGVVADFTIIYPDPPSLIFPDQQAQITSEYPTFQWTPVTVPPDYTIYYSLKIVQVLDGQTPQRALEANIPQFEKDHLTIPTFTYPIDALPLDTGKTYAWRVTALDQNNFPPTHNNGKSQIYTFTYVNPDTATTTAGGPVTVASSGSGCAGSTMSGGNHTDINPSRVAGLDHLTIGGFLIHPDQIQQQSASDHTYKGAGYITWSPFGSPIKLAVAFSGIKINSDGAVYQGTVTTTATGNSGMRAWNSLDSASTPGAGISNLGTLSDEQYNNLDEYLSNHLVRSLGENVTPADFPLGFRNQNLLNTPTLALMGITFTPNGASMNVLYNLNIPDANKWISFFNTCQRITPAGMGTGSGDHGVLYLPEDQSVTLNGTSFRFKGSGTSPSDTAGGTYVKWNNEGLQTIVATAERSFSQDDIKSLNDDGTVASQPEKMQLKFTFTNWNNWIARAIPEHDFEIADLPGFSISVSGGGFYDHSTSRNPASLNSSGFPDNYTDGSKIGGNFTGLYFPDLTIKLPEGFKTYGSGSDERISFPFHNFILDDQGVTVHINKRNNVFPFSNRGDLGGWPFSIDQFNISIADDNWGSDMSMAGQLKLPLSNSGTIDYVCYLNTGTEDGINYNFNISNLNGQSYPLDVWPATMNLQNSTLNITHEREGFAVTATLNGTMSISIQAGHHGSPADVSLPRLPFQGITISNRDAEGGEIGISAEAMGSDDGADHNEDHGSTSGNGGDNTSHADNGSSHGGDGEQPKAAGFPVNLDEISFTGPTLTAESNHTYKLDLGLRINLSIGGGKGGGIGAGTDLDISGDIHVPGTRSPYIDNRADSVDGMSLSAEGLGPLKLSGELDFFHNDETYGHGVRGNLEIEIPHTANVRFQTIFGTKQVSDGPLHYWGISGRLYMEDGIVDIGPITVNGLGGGFAYNMTIAHVHDDEITRSTSASENAIHLEPANLRSAHSVVVQLQLYLSFVRPKLVNGVVTVAINASSSAFDQLDINGYVALLSANPPDNESPPPVGSADLHLNFNFDEATFIGTFSGNVLGGVARVPMWMYANTQSQDYYFWIGKPDQQDRVKFILLQLPPGIQPPIGPANPGIPLQAYLAASGYFDMGTELPPGYPPPLPQEISSHLGDKGSSDAAVQALLNSLRRQGNPGFAFGAEVQGGINLQLLFLYANVNALLGFDTGLEYVQNPPNACVANGQKFGFNNWYATGQIYASLAMDVGIHVDVWFTSGNFSIMKAGVWAALQAGLPNPTWMDGDVRIHGEVLGGMIKVDDSFPFKVGHACTIPYNPLDHIKMITDAGPKDNAGVFDKPFAVFSLPMNKEPMSMTVPPDKTHDTSYTRKFRFYATRFDLYKVKRSGADSLIQGRPSISSDGKTITLYRNSMLQAHTRYKIYVKCKAEEEINNRWRNPAEGARVQDTTIFFNTGPAPNKIALQNIVYTYPINGQRYLLKNEFSNKGRIKLGMWQSNILPSQSAGLLGGYQYLLKFIPESGGADTITTHFTLNRSNRSLDFQIPQALKNSTTYTMQVWVKPAHRLNASGILNNFSNNIQIHQQSHKNATVTTLQRNSAGLLVQSQKNVTATATINYQKAGQQTNNQPLGSQPIYTLRFRTSKFNTFAEKMDALDPLKAGPEDPYRHIEVYSNNESAEKFDVFEIKGYTSRNTTGYPAFGNQKQIPPLFSASIPYDASNRTDKYFMDNLYVPAARIGLNSRFRVNMGAPEVRSNGSLGSAFVATFGAFPRYTLSTEDMPYSPKLAPRYAAALGRMASITGTGHQSAQIVNAFNGRSGTHSLAGTQTMGGTGGSAAGNNVSVPSSYAGLHFHNSNVVASGHSNGSGGGSSGTGILAGSTSMISSSTIGNIFPPFHLEWKRDEYIHADYQLLKQFYHTYENLTQNNTIHNVYGSGPYNYAMARGEYGSITFISGNLLVSTRLLNTIKNLSYVSTRQLSASRDIRFQYHYPCLNCSVSPITVTKHLNVLRISGNARQQMQQAQQSQNLQTGNSSAPLILHFK